MPEEFVRSKKGVRRDVWKGRRTLERDKRGKINGRRRRNNAGKGRLRINGRRRNNRGKERLRINDKRRINIRGEKSENKCLEKKK